MSRMIKAYLAGPFFNQSELEFTEKVMRELEIALSTELSLYVPHIHTGLILTSKSTDEDRKRVFKMNLDAMNEADLYILLLDNEDSGTCWEMGYGYARNLPLIGYWSDVRKMPNLMLYQSSDIVSSIPDLIIKLKKKITELQNRGL